LQKKFRNLIKIVKYFSKDTIIYVDNFDIKVVIREEFAKRIRRQDYNTKL